MFLIILSSVVLYSINVLKRLEFLGFSKGTGVLLNRTRGLGRNTSLDTLDFCMGINISDRCASVNRFFNCYKASFLAVYISSMCN